LHVLNQFEYLSVGTLETSFNNDLMIWVLDERLFDSEGKVFCFLVNLRR